MRFPFLFFFGCTVFFRLSAQQPPVAYADPNKVIELQENITEVRDIYRGAKVKQIKEFFQATTSEPKFIATMSWIDPEGRLTRHAYYQERDSIEVTDYFYHADGKIARTVNRVHSEYPETFINEYTYDNRGRLSQIKGTFAGKTANGATPKPKLERYVYDDTTGFVSEVTRTGREREKYVFSVDTPRGQVFKACYKLGKDTEKLSPDQDPYAFYLFTFNELGDIAINEYHEDGSIVFKGQYAYRGPGQYLVTINKEYPHKAVRSDFVYDERGLLTEIRHSDGSTSTFEYTFN